MADRPSDSSFGEDTTFAQRQKALQNSTDELQKLEQGGDGGSAKVTDDIEDTRHVRQREETDPQTVIHRGHATSFFFVCTIFLIGMAATLLLSPSLLLVNTKEHLVNDLDDSLTGYYTYTKKVLGKQIGGSCDEKTIKCKFSSMSPGLKTKFEKYGFKVIGQTNSLKRTNVGVLTTPNGAPVVSGSMLNQLTKADSNLGELMDKVFDPKTNLFQDRKFPQRLQDRFHIQQGSILGGATLEDVDDSFNEGLKREADSLDANGRGVYGLQYLQDSGSTWATKIFPNLINKTHTHLSLACALATYANLADNSVRQAKAVTLARFAMHYMALADEIKAGTAGTTSERIVESLSNKLTKRDASGKSATDASSYKTPALHEAADLIPSQYMNNPLLMLTILKALGGSPNFPGTDYLRNSLYVPRNNASDASLSGLCSNGMAGRQAGLEQGGLCWTPASMPLATYISAAAGGMIGGLRQPIEQFICPASLQAVVELVKTAILLPGGPATSIPGLVTIAARQEASNYSASKYGTQAMDAIFAGTGIILGDRAQSLGMRPASALSLKQYLVDTSQTRMDIASAQTESARSTPWDASNPNSLFGSTLSKLYDLKISLPEQSLTGSFSSLLSLLPKAASALALPTAGALYSQPLEFNITRLRPGVLCGIPANLDISPDFACNVRYSMSKPELDADIDDAVEYMTKPHPDNANASLSSVQGKDTAVEPEAGGRMKSEAQQGANAAYVDKTTGKPNKYTEYAKFLEYCVNRADPWGGVGMAVEYQDENYVPDPKNDKGIRTYGSNYTPDEAQKDEKLPYAYFGLAWGGATDQDWFTGKKCTDDSEMMKNFRAYTMACSVLADTSGAKECWQDDSQSVTLNDFYTSNDIVFKSLN